MIDVPSNWVLKVLPLHSPSDSDQENRKTPGESLVSIFLMCLSGDFDPEACRSNRYMSSDKASISVLDDIYQGLCSAGESWACVSGKC